MHILCWGTYDTGKPRARILLDGLRSTGVEVEECRADIWRGVTDKSQIRGFRHRLCLGLRWLFSYPRLAWQLGRAARPDVVLIGFPGILDILVAAPICKLRGIPLVWDMFMSLYDTVVEDRQLVRRGGLIARLLHALEGFALRRADLVFLDTQTHARRIETLFKLDPGSVAAIWVGAETEYFHTDPAETTDTRTAGTTSDLCVLFYGQFIPLHGIETIVHAARLTRDEPIEWQLIGNGQETDRIKALLAEQALPKLHWDAWVDYRQLPHCIAAADVCLGIFGTSEKAASVIPNKVFQIVAMGRQLITRDSPAIREMLDNTSPCVQLIPAASPTALANAVRALARQDRPPMHCHAALQGKLGAAAIGRQCTTLLKSHLGLES
ncbi:glycosyltransferase [Rhodanobacter sp. MP1X3]|uniref:glycosyltransferase n=1 Tax=Rhodanobacter sp. MP1X3 TaxID=2723086 RepID=UPI0016186E41|nr:glycosyltransferase [Rhodanobacter sp. MP1X3]MBB6242681.1 glycosyltransferase involved in cell wall biosynthesis [Rhodanobacter sp. MP1X3]